jgi:hypothetical protein
MQFLLMQVFGQRLNILLNDLLMHLAVYAFAMFITSLYIVAKLHGNDTDILELGVALIFGLLVFVVMRGDFFIHRAAAYEKYAESRISLTDESLTKAGDKIMTFEKWKSQRKNTWMVAVMDGVTGLYLIFLLTKFQTALWSKGDFVFVIISSILIVVAGVSSFFVPKLAGK